MCFSLGWIEQICILAIVVIGVVAILRLVIPYVLAKAGATIGQGVNVIIGALRIALWVVVAIIVVIICFDLIACLLGYVSLPTLKR